MVLSLIVPIVIVGACALTLNTSAEQLVSMKNLGKGFIVPSLHMNEWNIVQNLPRVLSSREYNLKDLYDHQVLDDKIIKSIISIILPYPELHPIYIPRSFLRYGKYTAALKGHFHLLKLREVSLIENIGPYFQKLDQRDKEALIDLFDQNPGLITSWGVVHLVAKHRPTATLYSELLHKSVNSGVEIGDKVKKLVRSYFSFASSDTNDNFDSNEGIALVQTQMKDEILRGCYFISLLYMKLKKGGHRDEIRLNLMTLLDQTNLRNVPKLKLTYLVTILAVLKFYLNKPLE